VRDYINLEDKSEYDFAIRYASIFTNQVDEYKVGDISELTFGFVKDTQYDLENGATFGKVIEIISDMEIVKDIGAEPLDKFVRFSNYLIESIKQIIDIENQTLSHTPDADEEEAGMNRFDDLGIYLQIRSIAQTFHIEPQKVREWKYSEAFVEMVTAKALNEYERELNKIKARKHG
jgi:hypothetical protein